MKCPNCGSDGYIVVTHEDEADVYECAANPGFCKWTRVVPKQGKALFTYRDGHANVIRKAKAG